MLTRKIKLCHINAHITCRLCDGYLIDATTVTECLHTCRSLLTRFSLFISLLCLFHQLLLLIRDTLPVFVSEGLVPSGMSPGDGDAPVIYAALSLPAFSERSTSSGWLLRTWGLEGGAIQSVSVWSEP